MGDQPRYILLIDDDATTRKVAEAGLRADRFTVDGVGSAEEGLALLRSARPALVLLDIEMPGMDGLTALDVIRRQHPALPVIMLTGRAAVGDRVTGLDLGADDYIVKPFSTRELGARVRAVLRRVADEPAAPIDHGWLVLDPTRRSATLGDRGLDLTPKEFDLLLHLMASPARAFSREELLRSVWQSQGDWQDPATVTEHVRRLRLKLEADPTRPRHLVTVRGVGYRFDP